MVSILFIQEFRIMHPAGLMLPYLSQKPKGNALREREADLCPSTLVPGFTQVGGTLLLGDPHGNHISEVAGGAKAIVKRVWHYLTRVRCPAPYMILQAHQEGFLSTEPGISFEQCQI